MSYYKRLILLPFVLILLFFNRAYCRDTVVATKVIQIIQIDEAGKRLTFPGSIFYDRYSRNLFVVEPGFSKIIFYTPDYFPFMAVGKGYQLIDPVDIFVDNKGEFYIVSSNKNEIYVLSPSLILEKEIKMKGFKGDKDFIPNHVAVNPVTGEIYVTGVGKPFIVCFDKNGKFKRYLYPSMKVGNIETYSIVSNVGVDDFGRIYLVALDFGKIFVYDKDGNYLFNFGVHGANFGQLSQPAAVAVDNDKKIIYVADPMRHSVLAYDINGKFKFEFGGRGWAPGWFNYPTDLAVDNDGNVIVSDWLNERIQVLKPLPNKKVEIEAPPVPSNRAD